MQIGSNGLALLQGITVRRVTVVILLLIATSLIIRYVSRGLDALSTRTPRARFLLKWLEPILRITLWFVAFFLSFEMLAPSRDALVATIGSLAIAIGLGAQDLFRNVIGGLVILADRPYQLGDRVRIGDADGEIDHIGLRSTKLTTFGDTRVTIPNAVLLNDKAFNSNSGVPDCQVLTELFLPADTPPEEALSIGYEAAYTSQFLYPRKPVTVLLIDSFDRRPYLKMDIKAYVCDHRFQPQFQNDITARAKAEFLKRGMLRGWTASDGPGSNEPRP
jgi:small-conductance mechanosensitive channel